MYCIESLDQRLAQNKNISEWFLSLLSLLLYFYSKLKPHSQ